MTPMILHCPECGHQHIDRDEWATKSHHKHLCEKCGNVWDVFVESIGVVAKDSLLDKLFSSFKMWRKFRGGQWYRVCEHPHIQGGWMIWTRELLADKSLYQIIVFEDYDRPPVMFYGA